MKKWLSTREVANLVEDHYPATLDDIRAFCEDGTIPSRYAKRKKCEERSQWRIATKGLRWILEHVLDLQPEEIAEVAEKAPVNFRRIA